MMENGQGLSVRAQKVQGIFKQFDRNQDGCLNRQEMAALVIAVNPRVKFSKEQIEAILDEVFRTYGEFIDGLKGLSFDGLLRTYDDGAGDVDRDFDALGLQLHYAEEEVAGIPEPSTSPLGESSVAGLSAFPNVTSIADESSSQVPRRSSKLIGAWARSPNHGIVCDDTWKLIEDLELLLKRVATKIEEKRKQREEKKGAGLNGVDTIAEWEDTAEKGEGVGGRRGEEELGNNEYGAFKKALAEFREKAGKVHTPEEAFDRHMAMGRSLFEHCWHEEALASFRMAVERKPQDVRAHFLVGNSYYSLQKYKLARESYQKALEAGEENAQQWESLLPQVQSPNSNWVVGAICHHYL